MAKKKRGKTMATVKKGKKTGAHATGRKKAARPRSQSLPGMERIRSAKLDDICESIGQGRDEKNKIASEEKDELRLAMKEMVAKGIDSYSHAGVRLVRVPGEEKLLVKKSKEEASTMATSSTETAAERAGNGEETVTETEESIEEI